MKCSRCHLGFDRNDLVMRARSHVYHVDCFRCVACSRRLVPGDEFALSPSDDGLLCRADHDVIGMTSRVPAPPASPSSDTNTITGLDDVIMTFHRNNNNNDDDDDDTKISGGCKFCIFVLLV